MLDRVDRVVFHAFNEILVASWGITSQASGTWSSPRRSSDRRTSCQMRGERRDSVKRCSKLSVLWVKVVAQSESATVSGACS